MKTWAYEVKSEKHPELQDVQQFIPKCLDKNMFVKMIKKIGEEIIKRMQFELRLIELFDKTIMVNEAQSLVLNRLQTNSAHWFKNVYNTIQLEIEGKEPTNMDILAVRSLYPLIEKYYYSLTDISDELRELAIQNDKNLGDVFE